MWPENPGPQLYPMPLLNVELEKPAVRLQNQISARAREAVFADYEAIVSLMRQNGMETLDYDDWKHLWTNNPELKRLQCHWPMGWVLENPTGEVVGFGGNVPVGYEFNRHRISAAVAHSWVVANEYRKYSMLLASK